jgi:hypothetical protein
MSNSEYKWGLMRGESRTNPEESYLIIISRQPKKMMTVRAMPVSWNGDFHYTTKCVMSQKVECDLILKDGRHIAIKDLLMEWGIKIVGRDSVEGRLSWLTTLFVTKEKWISKNDRHILKRVLSLTSHPLAEDLTSELGWNNIEYESKPMINKRLARQSWYANFNIHTNTSINVVEKSSKAATEAQDDIDSICSSILD